MCANVANLDEVVILSSPQPVLSGRGRSLMHATDEPGFRCVAGTAPSRNCRRGQPPPPPVSRRDTRASEARLATTNTRRALIAVL